MDYVDDHFSDIYRYTLFFTCPGVPDSIYSHGKKSLINGVAIKPYT